MTKDVNSVNGESAVNENIRNGLLISKMPKATAEQLNLAKLINKSTDESAFESQVHQVQDCTACTTEEAVSALHDCGNDLHRAIEYILDNKQGVDDWHMTVKKRPKSKKLPEQSKAPTNPPETSKESVDSNHDHDLPKDASDEHDSQGKKSYLAKRASNKRRLGKPLHGNDYDKSLARNEKIPSPVTMTADHSTSALRNPTVGETWDIEYGEWKGEAIEIVNSNPDFPVNIHDDSELLKLVTTEPGTEQENEKESHNASEKSQLTPVEHTQALVVSPVRERAAQLVTKDSEPLDPASARSELFAKFATSKAPRVSFMPNVPVFFAPDANAATTQGATYSFGSKLIRLSSSRPDHDVAQPVKTKSEHPQEKSHSNVPSFDARTETIGSKSPTQRTFAPVLDSLLSNVPDQQPINDLSCDRPFSSLQNSSVSKATYAQLHERDISQNESAVNSFEPQNSFENYLLDELSQNMNKVNLDNRINKTDAFTQSLSTSQQDVPAFHQVQAVKPSVSQALAKAHQTMPPTTNQSVPPGQSHPQMHPTLSPGIPPLINQFHAPFPMYNLHGGSGASAPLLDMDQLQALHHQQRFLLDMQQQHQTTQSAQPNASESGLTNTCSDVLSSSKSTPMNHVTAANAGIRPDLLASTLGHQMMNPAAPFLSYNGFLLMNGYPNAFLNQQQASPPSVTQSQGSGPGASQLPQNQPTQQQYAKSLNSATNYPTYQGIRQSNFDELSEISYQNMAKQVGYKHGGGQQQVYGSQSGQPNSELSMASKLQQSGGCQTNIGGLQQQQQTAQYPLSNNPANHFPPFYSPQYLAAMAAFLNQQNTVGNSSNVGVSGCGGNTSMQGGGMGSGIHGPTTMVMGAPGSVMHHQRSGPPQH